MMRIADSRSARATPAVDAPDQPKGDPPRRARAKTTETFERRKDKAGGSLAKEKPVPKSRRNSPLAAQLGAILDPLPTSAHRKDKSVELRPAAGVLFDGRPKLIDVEQGDNGDCFILAPALAAAAKRPDLLEQCIEKIDDQTYKVTVWIHDESHDKWSQRSVEIDTDMYVNKTTGKLAYAQGREVSEGLVLWPLLFEKAMTLLVEDEDGGAPARGSFNTINGGYEKNVLKMLTGVMPQQTDFNTDPPKRTPTRLKQAEHEKRIERVANRAWERLVAGFDAGGIAVMSTPGEAGTEIDPELNLLGICGGHVYGVVSHRELDGQRLVTLQNPWRSFEPGDTDPAGTSTPDDGEEDGQFEVPIEWLVEYFQDMHVAVPE